MKAKVGASLVLALIGTILVSEHQHVFACYTFSGHTLNGGVGNWGYSTRYYYVSSSASNYSSSISTAMSDWVNSTTRTGISTSLSYRITTTQSSSVMDWYAGNYYDVTQGIVASTEFWVNQRTLNPNMENWGWNKELLNLPSFTPLTSYEQKGTIAHEMGHAFGLDHNQGDIYSIMCQLKYGRAVSMAGTDDLNGINSLYK
jgi:hypothetical protein